MNEGRGLALDVVNNDEAANIGDGGASSTGMANVPNSSFSTSCTGSIRGFLWLDDSSSVVVAVIFTSNGFFMPLGVPADNDNTFTGMGAGRFLVSVVIVVATVVTMDDFAQRNDINSALTSFNSFIMSKYFFSYSDARFCSRDRAIRVDATSVLV